MKVLIDTNVILDVLCNREEFATASGLVMKYCETDALQGYVSALSFPNLVYILRKELNREKTRELIGTLSLIFSVADLSADNLKEACLLDFDDYEDALQSVTAAGVGASYIVTRNIRDFQRSGVPAITPDELLKRMKCTGIF